MMPPWGLLQPSLDQIIGEAGHGDLPDFGFVVKGADKEPREGRGVVLSGHGSSWVMAETKLDSDNDTRELTELRKGG
jgi:hypothetical protein